MKTFYRGVALLLIIGIIFGGIFLIYSYFASKNDAKFKILTITRDGKFSTKELKIANGDKFKVKNSADKNHTVKISRTDKTLAELDSGEISKELDLKDNSTNSFYLASNTNQKSEVVVGKPAQNFTATKTTTIPEATTKPAEDAVKAANTVNEPLPNTGPGELVVYPILAILGYFLFNFSTKFWKLFIR